MHVGIGIGTITLKIDILSLVIPKSRSQELLLIALSGECSPKVTEHNPIWGVRILVICG